MEIAQEMANYRSEQSTLTVVITQCDERSLNRADECCAGNSAEQPTNKTIHTNERSFDENERKTDP
jgi:hypothetical protein